MIGTLAAAPARGQGADDCAAATPISGLGTFAFSNVGSTDSGLLGSCGAGPSSDVWFAWTSGSETDYHFAICNVNYDAVLVVYDACAGVELGCEDAVGCTDSLNDLELDVTGLAPNTTYLLQLDGWTGLQGSGDLVISAVLPPPNDTCPGARPVGGAGTFAFDTSAAGTDGAPAASCDGAGTMQVENDVWFRWTAPADGRYEARTCELTPLDTRVAVYADACPPGAPIACDDDTCQFQSRVLFGALGGQSYLVRVGSFSPLQRGEGSVRIAPLDVPANDACAAAALIAGSGPFAFDTSGAATDGPAHPTICEGPEGRIDGDVWFRWTASTSGPMEVSTCGGTRLDTQVAVYLGSACPPGAPLACANNECDVQSRAVFSASAGQEYLVRIGGFGPAYRGSGSFTIDVPVLPLNDLCAAPEDVAGVGTFAFDTTGAATDGPEEPACASFSSPRIENDVWLRWTAPGDETYVLSTCGGTELDTRLAVYDAGACPPAAPLACDDDACGLQSRVLLDATAGATYLLRVGSFSATDRGAGTFTLEALSAGCGAGPGTAACLGLGCPCDNDDLSAGCANSTGAGGRLCAGGTASVAADDLVLTATQLPPNNSGLFYMGDAQGRSVLYDGFQCALGTTFRFLGAVQSTGPGGTMSLGPGVVAASAPLIQAGETWHFHGWHRDVPGSPCGTGANLTNLYSVTFAP